MSKTKIPKQPNIKVVKEMRDYSCEPAFIKAAERATEFLKKHPLPEEFLKPQKSEKGK